MRDRLAAWRNRLVASPAFQRFAAGFPLTRPIATRQSQALFDLCAGFVYAQILAACVELGLFEMLEPEPLDLAGIASRTQLPEAAAVRLLDGAVALDLLERRAGGRYGLAMLGAALRGNPGIARMIAHHRLLYADLADPVGLLRGEGRPTRLEGFWDYATSASPSDAAPEAVAAYSALMADSQHFVADDLVAAHDFRRHRAVLDIGGGDGAFLRAIARHAPAATLTVFDLPAVTERATLRFAQAGLTDRARAIGGDMHRDPLPGGADLVTLVRVLHDHDDDAVRALLARLRQAMAPGATLLIAEPMAGLPGTARMADAYFGFYLLAMGSGRARTPAELCAMLQRAGFTAVKPLATRRPLLMAAIVASVPDSTSVK